MKIVNDPVSKVTVKHTLSNSIEKECAFTQSLGDLYKMLTDYFFISDC